MKKTNVMRYIDTPKNYTGAAVALNGDKMWLVNGELHREDGPAVERPNGKKCWYKNGKRHREEGPCTTCKDCLKGNFVLCTKPGPAVEWSDGHKVWYLNGEAITKKQFKQYRNLKNLGYPNNLCTWIINYKNHY